MRKFVSICLLGVSSVCVVNLFSRHENCSLYEIYPQNETPHLTQIAHLDFDPSMDPRACLLPDTVIWYGFYSDRIVFRVWDYRLNHSISFSVDTDVSTNCKVYFFILSKVQELASNLLVGNRDENCCHRLM